MQIVYGIKHHKSLAEFAMKCGKLSSLVGVDSNALSFSPDSAPAAVCNDLQFGKGEDSALVLEKSIPDLHC